MERTQSQQPEHSPRRVIATGITRRAGGRTITVRATQAGVTGTITPTSTPAVAR